LSRALPSTPVSAGPLHAQEQEVLRRFMLAWQSCDIDALAALQRDDAVLHMPPLPVVYVGREAVARFFGTVPAEGRLDRIRLVPSRANGQPAVVAYMPDGLGAYWAYGVMVLAVVDDAIQAITGFQDASLFDAFDLPHTIA
jgi:RNA polymerase sigma-70 factor, ECF subfamily